MSSVLLKQVRILKYRSLRKMDIKLSTYTIENEEKI